jgi:hypothetical protein
MYYPLRILGANGWSPIPPEPEEHAGKVLAVSKDTIKFDLGNRIYIIGFACEPVACRELDDVKPGDEIQATFGVALESGRDTFINKLLAVHKCRGSSCAAVYAKQRAEEIASQKFRNASEEKQRQCYAAMEQTLVRDPRYIPDINQRDAESLVADADIRFNLMTGEKRTCGDSVVENHQNAVFDACELHKCGENIAGGCWHISSSVNAAVIEKAVEKCGI